MLSCGTDHTKYTLGEPTKFGISSVAVGGVWNTTSVPLFLSLNVICGRLTFGVTVVSSTASTLFTS